MHKNVLYLIRALKVHSKKSYGEGGGSPIESDHPIKKMGKTLYLAGEGERKITPTQPLQWPSPNRPHTHTFSGTRLLGIK